MIHRAFTIWLLTVIIGTLAFCIAELSGISLADVPVIFLMAIGFTIPSFFLIWGGLKLTLGMEDVLERIVVLITTLAVANAAPMLTVMTIFGQWDRQFVRTFLEIFYIVKPYVIISVPVAFSVCGRLLNVSNDRFLESAE